MPLPLSLVQATAALGVVLQAFTRFSPAPFGRRQMLLFERKGRQGTSLFCQNICEKKIEVVK